MKCIKHNSTGSGGCQRGAVSQTTCYRKAAKTRVTSKGRLVRLCAACDAEFGKIVGLSCEDQKGIQPPAAAAVPAAPARSGAGTDADPIRYEHIDRADPRRRQKLAAQLDQFEQDAKAGKVLCLSDLMISAGM